MMALTMVHLVDSYRWRWPDGKKLQVQVGIHFGPAVAGVAGLRTYSYHLFGDTVNTSSRMCSYSLPGKVHLSESAHRRLLEQTPEAITEPRGKIGRAHV